MTLRTKLQKTATRLVGKFGDSVNIVVIAVNESFDGFSPPTSTTVRTSMQAVVTGVKQYDVNETIRSSDLAVLVSGANPLVGIGGVIEIDGKQHTVIECRDILATGVKSAVKYFVRHG
jgi:hypothetical protein